MKISKKLLARLPGVYALRWVRHARGLSLLAATEEEGPCLRVSADDGKVEVMSCGPGGVMSLASVPGDPGMLVGIEKFYPVFRSEAAGLFLMDLDSRERRRFADLPFVHRCDFLRTPSGAGYLVAATLCGGKTSMDDWSSPGAVYGGVFNPRDEVPWRPVKIMDGLHKNHGMFIDCHKGASTAFVSGSEGIFSLCPPLTPDGGWQVKRIVDHEASDMVFADLNSDGVDELVAIEPFHGDGLGIYGFKGGRWECLRRIEGSFIHALWAGSCGGCPGIIAGNRGGGKELVYHRFRSRDSWDTEPVVLDEGVGAANVAVISDDNSLTVASANHATGEIYQYEIGDLNSAGT